MVVGLNHRTASVEFRERFAIPEAAIPAALDSLVGDRVMREVAILSTCNRVEIFGVGEDTAKMKERIFRFLGERAGVVCAGRPEFFAHEIPDSVQHLYEVCAGLDSMVVGETEILGQVKEAYRVAHEAHRTGIALNRLFQGAFAVAKEIRSKTRIGMGSVSVGSVAVDLAFQIFGDLADHAVLLVGAGETGETTARALKSRGVNSLRVANRSFERAASLAQSLGGVAVPWESWHGECARVDIVVSSTAAPHHVITRENLEPVMRQRKGAPLFLIDIAVPRDIEREVSRLDGVYLYDMDDLQVIAEQNLAMRQQEVATCRQIIRARADEFAHWFLTHAAQIARCPTARKLDGWRKAFGAAS